MELVNLYIWGGIGAAFCLFVGALYGHCRRERDYAATIKYQADTHNEWRKEHAEELEAAVNSFEFSDKFRKAIVESVVAHGLWNFDEHGSCPTLMLAKLCNYMADCALDVNSNQKAKNLYVKGVRAGTKKGREQLRKLMQKSIDNQAATIVEYMDGLTASRLRHGHFVLAVRNVLDDKIALPGVRRAIRKEISIECTRLRAVEAKKGE